MAQKLKGKSAVVTGGGGGIGGGIAKALAAEGAGVVVNDIPRGSDGISAADKVVDEIKNAGGNAVSSYDSVTTMEGGENIIKTAVSNFGRLDILVNCAGNFKPMTSITEMTEDDWDSVVDVHLKGHFSCIKAAAAEMIKQESGRIITFSSRAAFAGGGGPRPSAPPPPPPPEDTPRPAGGPPGMDLAYTAAKAGIVGLTMALSGVLGAHGITVNAILPSANTNLFPGTTPRGGIGVPATVFLDPEYLAPIVVYLSTDEAQDITGQLFYASGGDVCIYNRPLQPKSFIRKNGKWTIDELGELIPPLL